jgi:hypothetical protein
MKPRPGLWQRLTRPVRAVAYQALARQLAPGGPS